LLKDINARREDFNRLISDRLNESEINQLNELLALLK